MANESIVRLSVDASGVEQGVEKAKRSNAAYMASVEEMAKRTQVAQQAINEAVANGADTTSRKVNAFVQALAKQAEQAGKTRSELLSLQAAQMGITSSVQPYIDKIRTAEQAMQGGAEAAHGLNFATAGARRELLVLAHEASQGNWSRFGGSLMVLGERTDALKLVFSATGLAVGALIAAIAGFIYEVAKGHAEAAEFNRVITATGQAAGYSASGLMVVAHNVGALTGQYTLAAEAAQALASTGTISGGNLQNALRGVVAAVDVTGKKVEDLVKDFEELGKNPIEEVIKLNDQYNFLTESVFQQIRALDEEGRSQEAATVAFRAFADAMSSRKGEIESQMGWLERAWRSVKEEIAGAVEKIRQIGAPETTATRLASAREQLASWQRQMGANDPNSRPGREISALQEQIGLLEKQLGQENNLAQAKAASAAKERERTHFFQDGLKYLTRQQEMMRELNKVQDLYNRGIITQTEYQERAGAIAEKYKEKGHTRQASPDGAINSQISALQAQYKQIEDNLRSSVDHIKSLQQQGVIDAMTALQQEHDARSQALTQEIAIVQQEEELAKGKKQTEAYKKYVEELKGLQQKLLENDRKLVDDQEALRQKELRNVAAYQEALNKILKTRQNAVDNQIAGMGMGPNQREEFNRLNAARQEYDAKFAELTKSRTQNQISQSQYEQELAALNEFQQSRIEMELQTTALLRQAEGDWTNGATQAVNTYLDHAQNVAASVNSAFTSAFKGMEDALTTFITTGKLSFTSLANSIVAEITRMIVQAQIASVAMSLMRGVTESSKTFVGPPSSASNSGGSWLTSAASAVMGWFKSYDGGGYTGEGTRSGGLDGKGGFWAMLHPQETVVDHTKGQTLPTSSDSKTMQVVQHFVISGPADRRTQAQIAAAAQRGLAMGTRNL